MASCLLHDSSCVRPKHSGCVPMWAYAECQNPTCAKVLAPERPFRLEHSKIMSNNVLWGSGAPKKKPANSPSCNHSRVLLKYLSVPSCTLPQPSVPSCRVLRRFNHRQSPPVSVLKMANHCPSYLTLQEQHPSREVRVLCGLVAVANRAHTVVVLALIGQGRNPCRSTLPRSSSTKH